jgi:hypothetical protein
VTRSWPAVLALLGVLALQVPAAWAQSTGPGPGRIELSAGALWVGHQALGSNAANETTSTGTSLRIFSISSDLAGAAGVEGRVGVRLSHSLVAIAEASYTKPQVRVSISNDIENGTTVTAIETTQQYMIGGAVAWYLPYRFDASRVAPFVTAGGGYLRQLHEAATLVATGRYYQFGGGATYLFASRPNRVLKGLGLRAEARAVLRQHGIAFDTGSAHVAPMLAAALVARF